MSTLEISEKFKGLINGKDWEFGSLKLYGNDLASIFRGEKHFYVYKDSVSIYTGYMNTKGEEIYEGDILALEDELSVVFWDKVSQKWKMSSYPIEDPLFCKDLENHLDQILIGHIYTHEYVLQSEKVKTL